MPERVKMLWQLTEDWLVQIGLRDKPDAKVLEIGCGMGFLRQIHLDWNGAEYSKTAVERVKCRDGKGVKILEENAERL